jgi:PAS domain S-box-containing protein
LDATFGKAAPAFGKAAPAFGKAAPAFGKAAPTFGKPAPTFGKAAPALSRVRVRSGPRRRIAGYLVKCYNTTPGAVFSLHPITLHALRFTRANTMQIVWFGSWDNPTLAMPQRAEGYLLLLFYLAATLVALVALRKGLSSLRGRRLAVFVLLALATALFSNVLKLKWPNGVKFGWLFSEMWLPPIPGATGSVHPLEAPVVAWLLIGVTAAYLGVLPATLTALVSGLVRGAFETGQLLQVFEAAGFGLVIGFLLNQDYAGWLGKVLRQPVVAVLLASLAAWLLRVPILFVSAPAPVLYTLNYAVSYSMTSLSPRFWTGIAVGVALQLFFRVVPRLAPVRQGSVVPPYGRSLQQRLLFALVPLMLLIIVVLVYAVTVTGVRVSTEQILAQIERDAGHAAARIPLFFAEGRALLARFALDEALRSPDSATRQVKLQQDINSPAFFSELILLDHLGEATDAYPTDVDRGLQPEERQILGQVRTLAISQSSEVYHHTNGDLVISFMAPLDQTNVMQGILLGRVSLSTNPNFRGILDSLQGSMGAGTGFIVDRGGRIVAHPNPAMRFQAWQLETAPLVTHKTQRSQSRAYENLSPPDNLQRLVYYGPVEGYPWTVVIEMPYEVIVRQALGISTPLLIRLLILAVAATVVLFFAAHYLMQPVEQLASVAGQIAAGRLDIPVETGGEDEVGRLRTAFERMRLSLKERLDQLSLLWQVGRAVSSSLELTDSLLPILAGALEKTGACAARVVLLSANGAVEDAVSLGPRADLLAGLDPHAAYLVRTDQQLLIHNLARQQQSSLFTLRQAGLRALYGLPLTTRGRLSGVFWLAFDAPRPFDAAEVDFLSTLAGQAAVAAQNARLFAAARDGRQRMEAILSSASDAIIVTDAHSNLLLANPAAEEVFRLLVDAQGQPIETLLADGPEAARQLFAAPLEGENSVLTDELTLSDGRVLYASVCAVNQQPGQMTGRVAVLRDITYLKELDQMKSDFVNTVSHDLRSPLTFMQGYVTMIPMVGEVNPKQQEFVNKIATGIDQMTTLIDDLLNIGRIEAGVDIEMSPCRMEEVVRDVVQEIRPRAIAKKLELTTHLPETPLSPVWGDQVLLKHALTNLVDNAIKYTFEGNVAVGLAEQKSQLVVWVRDTGIGIAAANMPRLFEKFYRIKRRDTISIKGTGLGLAIVKSIADKHSGKVWVESKLNQGSTFFFAVPRHTPQ